MGDLRPRKVDSKLTIIVATYNASALLSDCLSNLRKNKDDETSVIVVDDGSNDGTEEMVRRRFPEVQLIRSEENLGFAGACNLGLQHVSTPYVGFVNNDAFPQRGWDTALVRGVEREASVALLCSKVRYRGAQILDSVGGVIEYPLGDAPPRGYLEPDGGSYDAPADIAYATGTAMVGQKQIIKGVGGFDVDFRNYFEETDLAWRLRLMGFRIRYEPGPSVEHLGSFTLGKSPVRKFFYLTRNRCMCNLKNLEARNIPVWLFCESIISMLLPFGALLFPTYRHYVSAYFLGVLAFVEHLPSTLNKRRQIQFRRRLPDSVVLKLHRRVGLNEIIIRYLRLVRGREGHLFGPNLRAPDS